MATPTAVVERNGEPVARVVPLPERPTASLGEVVEAWAAEGPPDPTFARDLDAIGATDEPVGLVIDTSAFVALERGTADPGLLDPEETVALPVIVLAELLSPSCGARAVGSPPTIWP